MDRFSRRTVSVFLLLCLLLGSLPLPTVAESSVSDFSAYTGDYKALPYFYSLTEEGAVITDCLPSARGDARLPDTLGGKPLVGIASEAFSGCSLLTSVTVPDSVTTIEERAFDAGLRLLGAQGSATEHFAAAAAHPFSTAFVRGDADANGRFESADLLLLAKYMAGWDLTVSEAQSDFDSSNSLSSADLLTCAKLLAGWTLPRLAVAGDEYSVPQTGSTAYFPAAGFSEHLANYVSSYQVVSFGQNGKSAKSFAESADHLALLSTVSASDCVLLCFGVHDADSLATDYANPTGGIDEEGSFAYYLYHYYIEPLRAVGAVPVLVTPVVRRPEDGATFTETCLRLGYPEAIRTLAAEQSVPLVDLTARSLALYQDLGAEQSAYLQARTTREAQTLQNGLLSVYGSDWMARLVADGLSEALPEMREWIDDTLTPSLTAFVSTYEQTEDTSVFTYTDGSTSTTTDTTISQESYAAPEGEALVSAELAEGVLAIAQGAFEKQYELEKISLPSTLTTIGDEAFYACHHLQLSHIPDAVTYLGESAFYGCSSITLASPGNRVTSILPYTFYGCSSITYMDIEWVTDIGAGAFGECTSLDFVFLSPYCASIGRRAFERCSALTELTIEEGTTDIGAYAFSYTALTEVTLPSTLQSIGARAFYSSTELAQLTYPARGEAFQQIALGDEWYLYTLLVQVDCLNGEVTTEGVLNIDNHAYYTSFDSAFADALSGTTENANLTREEKAAAKAAILLEEDGGLTFRLLSDATVSEMVSLSGDFTFDLNGYTLTLSGAGTYFAPAEGAQVTFRDSVGGGLLTKTEASTSGIYLFNQITKDSVLTIESGSYSLYNTGTGGAIALRGMGPTYEGADLIIIDGAFSVRTSTGNARVIQAPDSTVIQNGAFTTTSVSGHSYCVSTTSEMTVYGGIFDSYTSSGNSIALYAGNATSPTNLVVHGGEFVCHSTSRSAGMHIALSATTNTTLTVYGGTFCTDSRRTGDYGACAIATKGDLVFHDGYVQGISAGLQFLGTSCTIYDGTFIGADHGGAYLSHDEDVEIGDICVFGGIFQFKLEDWQTSTSGTGSVYINGGGNVYIDSATFLGEQVSLSSDGGNTYPCNIYVSNSTAPSWRIDSQHTLYLGAGMGTVQTTGAGKLDATSYPTASFNEAYVSAL